MTEEHSYNIAMEAINSLGQCGAAFADVVKGAIAPVNTAITSYQTVRLKKIEKQLAEMENAHAEKMLKLQNKHEEKILEMKLKHEEFIISEQRKVIEKMIDAASAAYEKKLDFITAQQSCLEDTYSKERDLLSEHIKFLEEERAKCFDDAKQYALLSSELSKLEDSKSKLYSEYMTAQGNLSDAVKLLEIDKSFGNSLGNAQNKLLGNEIHGA